MATTDEQIQKLEEAIASGAKTIEYDNRKITYKSTDDMLKALALLRRKKAGGGGVLNTVNPRTGTGL